METSIQKLRRSASTPAADVRARLRLKSDSLNASGSNSPCEEESVPAGQNSAEAVKGSYLGKPVANKRRSSERTYKVSFSSDNVYEVGDDPDAVVSSSGAEGSRSVADTPGQTDRLQGKDAPAEKSTLRSKSFGSMSRIIVEALSKIEGKSKINRVKQFQKLFSDIPADETLLRSFSCALMRDNIPIQGRMFITANWVCFYANILGYESKVAIPVSDIRSLHKIKTAFVVPNAISVHTDSTKYVFGSLLRRRTTYKALMRVWEGEITGTSRDDEDKSTTISQDGSSDQEGQDITSDDDQILEEEESDVQPSSLTNKHHFRGNKYHADHRNGQQLAGKLGVLGFMAKLIGLAGSLRTMQLVLPLVILVICCLTVSSFVLSYRIARVQSKLERIPDLSEAMEWNSVRLSSQSAHMEQVSELRESFLLSLQLLNKMQSTIQLLKRFTAKGEDNSPT